ncbi:ISL3 family transposase, partial [Staphylococcus aureus]|nr:ISL3 family transposase [Staphylococcus aureus]
PKISEYPTYIMLRKQRFKCKTCERYFTAETPEVDKYCFISKKPRSAVLNKAAEIRSEKSIAKSCSVSATTVSRIIDEAAQSLHQSPYSALPEHIMMDEFKSVKNVSGKMSFIYA